jgi:hypothetical protein
MRRYACSGQRGICVYGNGVGGAIWVLVTGDHLRERERLAKGGQNWCADEAGCVPDHEGHFGGGNVLRGDDEVAFIFAREIIENDYEVAIFWGDKRQREVFSYRKGRTN